MTLLRPTGQFVYSISQFTLDLLSHILELDKIFLSTFGMSFLCREMLYMNLGELDSIKDSFGSEKQCTQQKLTYRLLGLGNRATTIMQIVVRLLVGAYIVCSLLVTSIAPRY